MAYSSNWKVLLIDDEKDIRDVLTISLQDAGYEVVAEADGPAGLLRFEAFAPQIVITDIRMPGIDGIQVLEAIKKNIRIPKLLSLPPLAKWILPFAPFSWMPPTLSPSPSMSMRWK